MFPPSNSYNDFSSTMPGSSFAVDKNSVLSSQDEPTPPFWQFPAHFIDYDDGLLMSHLLSQAHQQILSSSTNMAPWEYEIKPASPIKETKKVVTQRKTSADGNGAKQGILRKRAGKKDRHSKIYTAHGPRDRRMRLSLQIARKFFDLQDMLGFDKASKTIEWLFSKSKAAIKELTDNLPGVKHSNSTGGGKSGSSTSDSEVVSAAKECEDNTREQQQGVVTRVGSIRSTAREAKERKSRKPSFSPIARESRDKARARARERTIEKMKMRGLEKSNKCYDESNPNESERLQSSSLLETGKNLGSSTQTNSSPKMVAEEGELHPDDHHQSRVSMLEHEMDSVSIIEKFLGISRSAPRSSSSMFNYSNNIVDSSGENSEENCPIISGNWSMSNDRIRYGYCSAMTDIKESTGNAQEQNPSVIFMTDPNANTQDENPSSNLMVNSYARKVTHNSDLMNPSNSNTYQGRPTSILIMTNSSDIAGLHSQYQEKPTVASRCHNFY